MPCAPTFHSPLIHAIQSGLYSGLSRKHGNYTTSSASALSTKQARTSHEAHLHPSHHPVRDYGLGMSQYTHLFVCYLVMEQREVIYGSW
ncbi:unnamed protein product [Phytomonas sp. EM1]|nr:unnamed protein product [Phytomonas sp. EM1]|eukprot:CCW62119.1 unnamed protein product [Phytomonas sp. isolate EM1]